MISILRFSFRLILVAVLLVMLLLYWLLGTESGTQWVVKQANQHVEGLQLKVVGGRVFGPLQVGEFVYESASLKLSANDAVLRWEPMALWQRKLDIQTLSASAVQVTSYPSDEPQEDGSITLPDINLPIEIDLAKAQIDKFTLFMGDDEAATFEASDVQLVAELNADQLKVQNFQFSGQPVAAQLAGEVQLSGAWPLALQTEWRLSLPERPAMQGNTQLDGELQGEAAVLQLQHSSPAPYALSLNGNLHEALQALRVDAELNIKRLQLQETANGKAYLRGNLKLVGQPKDISAKGLLFADLPVSPEQRQLFLAKLNVQRQGAAIKIQQAVIEEEDAAFQMNIKGQVGMAENLPIDLNVNWKALQWPLSGVANARSQQGKLAIKGRLQDYRLNGDMSVQGAWGPAIDFRLSGQGSDQQLSSLRLQGQWAADEERAIKSGSVGFNGRVRWAPQISWQGELNAKQLDPGWFAPDWPGQLNARVTTAASTRQLDSAQAEQTPFLEQLVGETELVALSGSLREQKLLGEGILRFKGEQGADGDLVLQLGDARLAADYQLLPRLIARWDIKAPNLSQLLPEAAGQLNSSGNISGAWPEMQAKLKAQATELRYGEFSMATLDVNAVLDTVGDGQLQLTLNADELRNASSELGSLRLNGSGTLAAHNLLIEHESEPVNSQLKLDGQWQNFATADRVWSFSLAEGRVEPFDLPVWRVVEAFNGQYTSNKLQLERGCWQADASRWCAELAHETGGRSQLQSVIEGFPLAWADDFMPATELSGEFNGQLNLNWPPVAGENNVSVLRLSAGQLRQELGGEWQSLIGWKQGELSFNWDQPGPSTKLSLELEGGGHVYANAAIDLPYQAAKQAEGLTQPPISSAPLDGGLDIAWDSLDIVPVFFPEIADLSGKIEGKLKLSGSLAQPKLVGDALLSSDRVLLPRYGVELSKLRAQLDSSGQRINFKVTAVSKGEVQVTGKTSWLEDEGLRLQAAVKGEAFHGFNTVDASIYVSPDLEVKLQDKLLSFSGKLHIPKGSITPEDLSSSVGIASDQEIIRESSDRNEEEGLQMKGQIRLTLGDQVNIKGYGLEASLGGSLQLIERPGQITRAQGDIVLKNGSYKAFGQELNIEQGRLIYNGGPVTKPSLDVVASRQVQNVRVGASVRGTIEQPKLRLFSEPSMSQTDTLAYLVMGRPIRRGESDDANVLANAAVALQLKGTEFFGGKIGSKLGLSEVSVDTDGGADQARLTLGKYLSPKLYVSYGVAVFDAENQVKLRYSLSESWRAEATSTGKTSGADIFYTIER